MTLVIASDHAGLALKNTLAFALRERGHELVDLGTHTGDSVDYPAYARPLAEAVAAGTYALGILICGTGMGMSIVANKVPGVRAALCTSEFVARMSRGHNDANVLCLGERVTGAGVAIAIAEAFLATPFEGGRHQRRVDLIEPGPGR
jgi:ribose 5-phosphate isomerase B